VAEPSQPRAREVVFVSGATGFIGRHLHPVLAQLGCDVVCGSRDPARVARAHPHARWVAFDVDRPRSIAGALAGCDAAYYLVHEIAQGRAYPEREMRAALAFRRAAEDAGVRRVVYLGGVAPHGGSSRHLQSRLATGAILRGGDVCAIELRAAMIIGAGSASFGMVRDLAQRLPAMILPRWLDHHSCPVAIDDVVAALIAALHVPAERSAWYDAPGPERVTHREVLTRTAAQLGHHPPMIGVPVLTPSLSSYWIALVSDARLPIARELVQGLRYELDPSGAEIWTHMPHWKRTSLSTAIAQALADQASSAAPSPRFLSHLHAAAQVLYGAGQGARA
jgi:uncharacterized protein YbjT (DUF2867 family)